MAIPTSEDKYKAKKKTARWLTRLQQTLLLKPKNRKQLVQLLQYSKQRHILDAQAFKMLEGVLQIADRHVRDIMVPHAKMTVISESTSLSAILSTVIKSGHSRFPVMRDSDNQVIGLLLAKDLLKYTCSENVDHFSIDHNILRPTVFIPESKRLDSLLEEFQHKHYHMAIVVDEYGTTSGLITIEDVLEEIVGEIEDEHDDRSEVFVQEQNPDQFIIKASMPIEVFNSCFKGKLETAQFDTIGGFISNRFGYLPKRGTSIALPPFQFKILRADNRLIRLLQVNIDRVES